MLPAVERRGMATDERLMLVGVIGAAALVLIRLSTPLPTDFDLGALAFWVALTLVASFVPVKLPGGVVVYMNTAPLIAAVFDPSLLKPFAICWIAFLGTFELRDFRRQVPWYGTLHNRSNLRSEEHTSELQSR